MVVVTRAYGGLAFRGGHAARTRNPGEKRTTVRGRIVMLCRLVCVVLDTRNHARKTRRSRQRRGRAYSYRHRVRRESLSDPEGHMKRDIRPSIPVSRHLSLPLKRLVSNLLVES